MTESVRRPRKAGPTKPSVRTGRTASDVPAAAVNAPAAAAPLEHADPVTRIVVRPIATPLSLGFLGLAAATFVVTGLQLGWVSPQQKPFVGLILLSFTAMLQLVATVYGFLTRDSVAATGMGVLTGTWFAVGLVFYLTPHPTATSGGLGLLLFASGTALLVPVLGALESKVLAAVVLGTAALRFFVTGAYQLSGSDTWKSVAGWLGLALFFLAVLAALAFEIEDTKRKPLAVTMRRGKGREALAGTVSDEIAHVHQEAGARETL